MSKFRDRSAAGEHLATLLRQHKDAIVLAIPAGGVPVGAAIAGALGLELHAIPVSKALYPWTTESGFGAVAFDGTEWIDQNHALTREQVAKALADSRAKVERRAVRFRAADALRRIRDRTIILVDDGIAAGSTMRAGVAALRKHGAQKIVVAVPTAHARSVEALRALVDDIVCPDIRSGTRFAVADAYEEWRDLADDEVEALLKP